MPKIVAFVAQKGGVGKTTSSMNVAAVLSQAGPTCLLDLDPQESAREWWELGGEIPFELRHETDFRAIKAVRSLPELAQFQYIVIDTPPSLEEVVRLAAEVADLVIVPVPAEIMPLRAGIRTIQQIVRPSGVEYRALMTRIKPASPGEEQEGVDALEALGIPHLTTPDTKGGAGERVRIREYAAHSRASKEGYVLDRYPNDSRGTKNAVADYQRAGLAILGLLHRLPERSA